MNAANSLRRQHLEEKKNLLEKQLSAVYAQLTLELDAARSVVINEQANKFAAELDAVEQELVQLPPVSHNVAASNTVEIQRYLNELIEKTSAYIRARQLVSLDVQDTQTAIQSLIPWNERDLSPVVPAVTASEPPAAPQTYHSFEDALQSCGRRMLLLGDAGAGKSTTLQSFALQAAEDRSEDPNLPVPVVVFLHRLKNVPFTHLSEQDFKTLLQNTAVTNGASLLHNFPLFYILDGLDEMGGESISAHVLHFVYRPLLWAVNQFQLLWDGIGGPSEFEQLGGRILLHAWQHMATTSLKLWTLVIGVRPKGDQRAQFLKCVESKLHKEQLVISCRSTEYDQIRQLAVLDGAVKLLPLSDEKIEEWLKVKHQQPQLWDILRNDDNLRELVRSPLLLVLLSNEFDAPRIDNLHKSATAHDLIKHFVPTRHRKEYGMGRTTFTLKVTENLLGRLAAWMWATPQSPARSISKSQAGLILGADAKSFIDFACTLGVMVKLPNSETVEFMHLAFRDYYAVPFLVTALKGMNMFSRWWSARILDPVPYVGYPLKLLPTLGITYNFERGYATEALAAIAPQATGAISALIDCLEDKNKVVRYYAARALAEIGAPASDAVPALIEALGDEFWVIRYFATLALGMIGPKAVTSSAALLKAVTDPIPDVRSEAVIALGAIGAKTADVIATLKITLHNKNGPERAFAAEALARLGEATSEVINVVAGELLGRNKAARNWAIQALANVGTPAVPAIVALLMHKRASVRQSGAEALGRLGPAAAEAVPDLIQALGDQKASVRSSAAFTLGNIGFAAMEAIPALLQALTDQNADVRLSAAYALGAIGPAAVEAVPGLKQALTDKDGYVRTAAIDALKRIQPETSLDPRASHCPQL